MPARWRLLWLPLVLAACAPAGRPGGHGPHRPLLAQPSDIVAAELKLASEARTEGQWTAFRDHMADGALIFVPRLAGAESWLDRPDPAMSIDWQPHQVYMLCDSSLAASIGAWQGDDMRHGAFLTIWQRQPDGEYRWLLDYDWPRDQRLGEPEFITTDIVGCPGGEPYASVVVPGSTATGGGEVDESDVINGAVLNLSRPDAMSVSIRVDGREEANLTFVGILAKGDKEQQGRVIVEDADPAGDEESAPE